MATTLLPPLSMGGPTDEEIEAKWKECFDSNGDLIPSLRGRALSISNIPGFDVTSGKMHRFYKDSSGPFPTTNKKTFERVWNEEVLGRYDYSEDLIWSDN